ncbi:unnamed protein product [Meganyctiphanes norvegica]|uniref:Uncharacterized protein n=1 Tax=Meganyctiphanes norvegica TaxID=48144 RepID=A0AAV2QAN7_MEGNR
MFSIHSKMWIIIICVLFINTAHTSPTRLKPPLYVKSVSFKSLDQDNFIDRDNVLNPDKLRTDPMCPAADSIFPCICLLELAVGKLNIDCSNVIDELQLRQVFGTDFPTKDFQNLTILNNSNIKILGNGVFGSVTFEHVRIMKGSLVTIEDSVFILSNTTLKSLDLSWNEIAVFPFPTLNVYMNLMYLCVKANNIQTFPIFASQSLLGLCMSNNPISILPLNPYGYLPHLEHIWLSSTKVKDLPPNMFSSLHKLETVNLHSNKINRINMDTFKITSQVLQSIDFSDNEIQTIEAGAFIGLHDSVINLESNKLTILPSDVWQGVVLQNVKLRIKGNPLLCGCDVAWAVLDPLFITHLEGAICADGHKLTDECKPCYKLCSPFIELRRLFTFRF